MQWYVVATSTDEIVCMESENVCQFDPWLHYTQFIDIGRQK